MPTLRAAIVFWVCVTLVASRLLGLHTHVSMDDHHIDATASIHEGLIAEHERERGVASSLDAYHEIFHQAQGDVDLNSADAANAKLLKLPFQALLFAALVFLLGFAPSAFAGRIQHRLRVPGRRLLLLPPSQAPPLSS